MKNSKILSFLKVFAPLALVAMFGSACSEEKKQEKLQDLPPVEFPKELPGLYSGRMPCDDCDTRMIRMNLNEDSTVVVAQTKIRDSVVTDTLRGTYLYADGIVKVSLSDNTIHWNYKRDGVGNLSYLTSSGSIYEDANGLRMDLIRIFKAPVTSKKDQKAKPENVQEK
ncbi:MAG: copper resistance protein NlpE N-terminal domain-containing protein [Fibrobacter sp.]|nr:copper resistance protein NlpE N-terminal domain-containing protein [Fibrobacter sp.]